MAAVANTQVSNAVIRLKELSADERTRMLYESRIKMERDIYSITKGKEDAAEKRGREIQKIEFAKKLIKRNRPMYEIIEDTGLTQSEIELL